MMGLEFELKVQRKNSEFVLYDVERKGLKVGLLALDKPYSDDVAIKKVLELK